MLLTERLRLRAWRDDDAAALTLINAHPEVRRYDDPLDDTTGVTLLARLRSHWERHGWGRFAIEERAPADGSAPRLLGFAGVGYPTFMQQLAHRPELGWRLDHAVWGRGYATEAAIAARADGYERLGLDELISIIHPDNERSRRVAQRLGMTIERQALHPALGIDVDVWSARRPA